MGAGGAIAGFQALGSIQEGIATKRAAKERGRIARMKSQIAEEQARSDAEDQRRQSQKVLGSIRADYAASGVTQEGSVLDVIESSAREADLDRQKILYRGKLESMGYQYEAEQARIEGHQATTEMFFGSASSFMTMAKPKPTTTTGATG